MEGHIKEIFKKLYELLERIAREPGNYHPEYHRRLQELRERIDGTPIKTQKDIDVFGPEAKKGIASQVEAGRRLE